MKKYDYSRVCLSASVYNLFIYFLISTEKEIDDTFYFTCPSVPLQLQKKLQKKYVFSSMKLSYIQKMKLYLSFILFRHIFFPYFKRSTIFAQDHLPFSPFIIGHNNYTLIEDAPMFFSVLCKSKMWIDADQKKQSLFLLLKKSLVSHTCGSILATSKSCEKIIETEKDIPHWISPSVVECVNINELWQTSTDSKKRKILDFFELTDRDIALYTRKKVLILTQPFFQDNQVTLEEQISIYSDIVEQYRESEILIKTHPRDNIDYTVYFPNIMVFNKPVPFQLLTVLGIKFDVAVTVCSTAINTIPYPIKKVILGSSVNAKISRFYGK